MFGDPVKNQNEWKKERLDKLCSQITDGEHVTPQRTDSGIKLLSARNIKNGFIDFSTGLDYISEDTYTKISKRCKPEFGDILMSCSGSIGRVTKVRINERFHLVRSVALMKPIKNLLNSDYLEYFLRSGYGQHQVHKKANKSSQANIFTAPIKSIEIIVPNISLQQQFAELVQKTETLKEKQNQSEIELDNLFNSLMQKAFNSQLVH